MVKVTYIHKPRNKDQLRLLRGKLIEIDAEKEKVWARACSKRVVNVVFL